MLLMQNAETINRLLEQGEFILKTYHAEYEKDPAGHKTEFLRGNLAGWHETLHTLYHDGAEEIVKSVVAKTRLDVPDSRSRSCLFTRPRHENSREQNGAGENQELIQPMIRNRFLQFAICLSTALVLGCGAVSSVAQS